MLKKRNIYYILSIILQKKGKKQLSLRLIRYCFNFIKKNYKINPFFVFNKALDNIIPPFVLIKTKKGTQPLYFVKLTPLHRRISLALRWLVSACKTIKQLFSKKLGIELCMAATKKGKAFEKKIDLLKKVEMNKTSLL